MDWLEKYKKEIKTHCGCSVELSEKSVKALHPITDMGLFFNCLECGTTLLHPYELIEKGRVND